MGSRRTVSSGIALPVSNRASTTRMALYEQPDATTSKFDALKVAPWVSFRLLVEVEAAHSAGNGQFRREFKRWILPARQSKCTASVALSMSASQNVAWYALSLGACSQHATAERSSAARRDT
jgi:hypothetical protein